MKGSLLALRNQVYKKNLSLQKYFLVEQKSIENWIAYKPVVGNHLSSLAAFIFF